MEWTEPMKAEVRHLWLDEGWSAGQIKNKYGVTRNAIISLVRRMGLTHQERPHKASGRRRIALASFVSPLEKTTAIKNFSPVTIIPHGRELPPQRCCRFSELEDDECTYAVNEADASNHVFCGRKRPRGRSYCPWCESEALTGPARKRDREIVRVREIEHQM
jgi:hypothetical protein